MFIQTEATPNPQTLKFLPGKIVLEDGTADFRNADDASASPLAERLFSINGVTGVFYGYDFVTVSKDGIDWAHLKPAVLGAIMEHYMSGAPIMETTRVQDDIDAEEEFFEPGDESLVATIKELLESRVRPAVFLNMKGSCAGCPSSTATLKHGVQNLLRHFIPEVQEVEAV
jgi:Fe-S cluster biogenesis protein NfuA